MRAKLLRQPGHLSLAKGVQRTPMGNPYVSPIALGYLWAIIPKNPWVGKHLRNQASLNTFDLDI